MKRTLLLLINGSMIVAYLIVASFSWRIPEEDNAGASVGTAGPAMVWATSALPLLFLAIVLNVIAFITFQKDSWPPSKERVLLYLALALAWIAAISVDFSHH